MFHLPHGPHPWRSVALRSAGATTLALVVGVGLVAWRVGVFDGNVHVVAAERVYRSAQLSAEDLRMFVAEHHIRCVLNLRRASEPTPEYVAERALCAELGVEFVSLPFSPSKLPEPKTVVALIDRFRAGPYPLLVHCEHGADRTGLASVVYDLVIERKELELALHDDLSWRTGHVGLGRERAMDHFFELYRTTRGARDFEAWAREVYPTLFAKTKRAKPRPESTEPVPPRA